MSNIDKENVSNHETISNEETNKEQREITPMGNLDDKNVEGSVNVRDKRIEDVDNSSKSEYNVSGEKLNTTQDDEKEINKNKDDEKTIDTVFSKTDSEIKYINNVLTKEKVNINNISDNSSTIIPERNNIETYDIPIEERSVVSSTKSDEYIKCTNCTDVIKLPARNILYCGGCQQKLEKTLSDEDNSNFVLREICDPCSSSIIKNVSESATGSFDNIPDKMVAIEEDSKDSNQSRDKDSLIRKFQEENKAMENLLYDQKEIDKGMEEYKTNEQLKEELSEMEASEKINAKEREGRIDINKSENSSETSKTISDLLKTESSNEPSSSSKVSIKVQKSSDDISVETPEVKLIGEPLQSQNIINDLLDKKSISISESSSLSSTLKSEKRLTETENKLSDILKKGETTSTRESSAVSSALKSKEKLNTSDNKLSDILKKGETTSNSEGEYTEHSFHKTDLPIIKDRSEIYLEESTTESEREPSTANKIPEDASTAEKSCDIEVKMVVDNKSTGSVISEKSQIKLVGEDTSYTSEPFRIPEGVAFSLSDSFKDEKLDSGVISIPTGASEFTVEMEEPFTLDLSTSSSQMASENTRIYKFRIEREKQYEKETAIAKGKVKNLIKHFEDLAKQQNQN